MDPQQTVRNYLIALHDPEQLKDHEKIAKLEQALADETDPIGRLELQTQLAQEKTIDADTVEADFISVVKPWADKAGISAGSLLAEGVSRKTLLKAGFRPKPGRGRPSTGKRVSREAVDGHIKALASGVGVTAQSLAEATGASVAACRKALAESEIVVDAGPDPEFEGPGRAPTIYRRP